jgi:hypothetical protein
MQLIKTLVTLYTQSNRNDAKAIPRFRTLFVRLGITVAHELCHVFTNYLAANKISHTPPNITYGPYGDGNTGESGRVWEFGVFGGFVDIRMEDGCEILAVS